MAAKKETSYISFDLDWLETKVSKLQQVLDSYDLEDLLDRRGPKELPNGRVVDGIIATKEQQMKAIIDTMERLQKMLPGLKQMRKEQDESEKAVAKGNAHIPARMQKKEE